MQHNLLHDITQNMHCIYCQINASINEWINLLLRDTFKSDKNYSTTLNNISSSVLCQVIDDSSFICLGGEIAVHCDYLSRIFLLTYLYAQ